MLLTASENDYSLLLWLPQAEPLVRMAGWGRKHRINTHKSSCITGYSVLHIVRLFLKIISYCHMCLLYLFIDGKVNIIKKHLRFLFTHTCIQWKFIVFLCEREFNFLMFIF